jgi:hypothetical protein
MTRAQEPRARKAADPRHTPIKEMLGEYWQRENPMVPALPWNGADAGALASFLRANPTITPEIVALCLEHRLRGEDHAPGERAFRWIGDLLRYASGPLNRFKQPMRTSPLAAQASLGTYHPGERYGPEDEPQRPLRDVMSADWQRRTIRRLREVPNGLSDLERDFLKEEKLL